MSHVRVVHAHPARPRLRAIPAALLLVVAACGPDRAGAPTAPSADLGAVPQPPIVWLHYDYMVSTDPANPHSHAPDPAAIAIVVDAYRRHGITLFVDPQHTAIPEVPLIHVDTITPSEPGCVSLRELRRRYFQAHGAQPWHYVVFGHYSSDLGCYESFAAGNAELPGYNFTVSLAHFFLDQHACPGVLPPDRCRVAEAGTFMHELGHNLDLRHGGGDNINNKPNYLSVMNYTWEIAGLFLGRYPGDTDVSAATRVVDYSGLALPDLDENHLDERAGLGGPPDDRLISVNDYCDEAITACSFGAIPTTGPVDWNVNGVIEPDVKASVNATYDLLLCGFSCPMQYQVLRGFDDWGHLLAFLTTPAYVTGTVQPRRVTP